MEKVLLTDVTGFIGLHCCKQLLDQGYAVRGTLLEIRSEKRSPYAMKESNTSVENLEIIELDLLNDEGWEEAGRDCDYVMHVASPITSASDSVDEEFLSDLPLTVLFVHSKLQKQTKQKSDFNFISCFNFYDDSDKKNYDENDWSDIDSNKITPVCKK